MEVFERGQNCNATTDAIVEVQHHLSDSNIPRTYEPLQYWQNQKQIYPLIYKLALKFLYTHASSVCENVFSKAGELVSKRRNRLGPNMVHKPLFLNKMCNPCPLPSHTSTQALPVHKYFFTVQ